MTATQPSNLEMTILSLLWKEGELTARQVLEAMPDRKKRAYTSILSALQVMEKKGLVRHTSKGVAHLYSARVAKKRVLRPMFQGMVTNLFGGSPASAMQHFLEAADVGEEDLAEIDRLVRDYKKNAGKKSGARGK